MIEQKINRWSFMLTNIEKKDNSKQNKKSKYKCGENHQYKGKPN